MNRPPPTVFVVDDDPSIRKSLARLLKTADYRAETFASARDFLDSGRQHDAPGCVVLDIRMPGLSGLDLQQELANHPAALPIVFITGQSDVPTGIKAMKDGAVDFLLKPFQTDALLQAVALAVERSQRARATNSEKEQIQLHANTLTPREREVLALVVTGKLNKQIALELGTTEKTIKVHRGRVMEKMGAKSFADLVRAAEKIGLPG